MKTYLFKFSPKNEGIFPMLEYEASFPGDGMAKEYAHQLLKSESNKMFSSVYVFQLHEYAGQEDKLVSQIGVFTNSITKEIQ